MLSVTVAGIKLPSPLLNASGAFSPVVFDELFTLREVLGGIVTKTVTPEPTIGNPQPRTVELPGVGMLNSIGLQNPGLAYFLEVEAPQLKQYGLPLLLSLSASSVSGFAHMVEQVEAHPSGKLVDGLELNLSCPNVDEGGSHFGSHPQSIQAVVAAVTQTTEKPVFAKLTPNAGDVVPLGEAALKGGAAGLTAINTMLGMKIDLHRRQPILPRVFGGYSGPGIKPIALHAIWQLHQHFPEVPLIGVGGISTAEDALEFIMAGASLVQIGTQCFRDPLVFSKIRQGITDYLHAEKVSSIQGLTGCAHPPSLHSRLQPVCSTITGESQ